MIIRKSPLEIEKMAAAGRVVVDTLAMIGERLIHSEGLKILDAEAPVLNRYLAELRAGRA